MLDSKELGAYIYNKYMDEYNTVISPIKLHKSLYFLYSYYQMLRRDIDDGLIEVSIDDYSLIPKELCEFNFEAWAFGPVDTKVYYSDREFFIGFDKDIFSDYNNIIKEYVDVLLDNIFNTNDFTLINMSKEDNAWKTVKLMSKMNKQDVIDDYYWRD